MSFTDDELDILESSLLETIRSYNVAIKHTKMRRAHEEFVRLKNQTNRLLARIQAEMERRDKK